MTDKAQELDKHKELRKRSTLANKVPRIFVMPSVDRIDAFDVELGGYGYEDEGA